MNPDDHILIVGAGTFGLSTALEILRKGHKNLTLIDPYPIPSPLSAGNDVNKIFQSVVNSKFYSNLSMESLKKWKNDKIYKDAYHETGIIYGASMKESYDEIQEQFEMLQNDGYLINKDLELLNNSNDFLKLIDNNNDLNNSINNLKLNDNNRFNNWKGYYQKKNCGWTFASLALKNVSLECIKLGAKIITDNVTELIIDKGNDYNKCLGIKTYSGLEILADKIIISAGANSVKLLDFENQLLAKCWTVGHIKLTKEEIDELKGSPVILNIDKGFVFEPDAFGDLKFCNEFPGYINMERFKNFKNEISIPIYKDSIPKEAEIQMREFLKDVYPKLSNRSFNVAKICWCTDTVDRNFLIDEHPVIKNLVLGTGDSGQGFKYMPIIGEYIAQVVLNGVESIPQDKRKAWRWRPETAKNRDIGALQQRLGGSNQVKDLKDISEWSKGISS